MTMDETQTLYQAFIFLLAAIITVPIAKALKLGSVLGYLCAGVLVGPFGLELAGNRLSDIMHFAELGIVMMLFVVGLELRPATLWRQRSTLLGLGGTQFVATTLAIAIPAWLFGLNHHEALAVGMILSLSSTAIVLQLLDEKRQMKTPLGRSAFSVLLFQDIAVIPVLAILPLLALGQTTAHFFSPENPIAVIEKTLTIVFVVGAIVATARFLLNPLFRIVAATKVPELFVATTLLIIISIVLLMNLAGLSAALGAFIAGMVLAESEYRTELEVGISPFKGLLLGLFFLSVGAGINFELLLKFPLQILSMLFGLVTIKIIILISITKMVKFNAQTTLMFAVILSQAGEFCFVLLTFASDHQVLGVALSQKLTLVVALSMALTPILILLNETSLPKIRVPEPDRTPEDFPGEYKPIILAGIGRYGQIVSRMLRAKGYDITVLEADATQLDIARKFGHAAYYGDAARPDVLEAAGISEAYLLILAIDDHDKILQIIRFCQKNYPTVRIIARATGRREAHEIMAMDAEATRETFHSSLYTGEQALRALGIPAYEAHRTAAWFKLHDIKHLRELTAVWGDEEKYLSRLRDNLALIENLIQVDAGIEVTDEDTLHPDPPANGTN